MRIGIVGLESDHAEDLLRLANRAQRWPDSAVTMLCGPDVDSARTAALARQYRAGDAADPVAMLGRVDAVAVLGRQADRHAAAALPFLEAGLPVFVDKPLAAGLGDAERMLAAASRSGASLLSASALRWQPDTMELQREAAAAGGIAAVTVSGPFDPSSPYGGSIYYGVHVVELALELAGPIADVEVIRADDTALVMAGRAGSVSVEMRMARPPDGASAPFHVAIRTAVRPISRPIGLGEDYMAPVFDRFMAMARGGSPPLAPGQMLASVRLLELGERALRRALSR